MTEASSGDLSHPMDFLLDEDFDWPSVGEVRKGWVVDHRNNEILVDIGAKSEGVIESREVTSLDSGALEELAIGNEVPVFVVNAEDGNGNIIVSYRKAAEEDDWQLAAELMENRDSCEVTIVGFNRGGALVNMGLVRGFVPNSQLGRDRNLNMLDSEEKQRAMQAMTGEVIKVKVIEVDRERNRLILSEHAARKEIRAAQRAEMLSGMNEGDIFDGRVVNMAEFGAFVDIGGVEGLVHLSELSWKRVNRPSDILEVGDVVKVAVLNVDDERQRIALSIKRLQADPWTMIDDTYQVGQLVEAKITRLTKFGAFARIDDDYELEGLIHISEMANDRIAHPRDVVRPEEAVTVRIIRIDPGQRQLGLSLKQVSSEDFIESDLAMLNS